MSIGKKQYEKRTVELVSELQGHCLLLSPKENLRTPLPSSVTSIKEWPNVSVDETFKSILSINDLAFSQNLNDFLKELQQYANRETRLYFCDRTTTPKGKNGSARNDITGSLWDTKWSVIHCERFTTEKKRSTPQYACGIARIKRAHDGNL